MIPVLIVPVLRPGLVGRMLASVDVPVGQIIAVDNGGRAEVPGAHVIRLPANLGVAASWNLGIKVTPDAPWWCVVNDDIVFAPGDLARLTAAMGGADLATMDGFAAFGISRACVERVGYFDENFHPAYCEDCDYEYRCRLAGVPIVPVPARLRHDRSSTIAEPRFGRQNARTYPENVRYFERKWGGPLRGGETFDSPFDAGGGVDEWTPDHARRRSQAWETTMLVPGGETR